MYYAARVSAVPIPVCGNARSPREIANGISSDVAQTLADRDTLDECAAQGWAPVIPALEQFALLMCEETAHYAKVIETANIRLQ